MVPISVTYRGDLRCQATHEPSGASLLTDAPRDNLGRGEAFSPSDLVATALLTCMVTTMGIVATRKGVTLGPVDGRITKEMVADPARRIGRLAVTLVMPADTPADQRPWLEAAAHGCPVHRALASNIEVPVTFHYGAPAGSAP